MHRFLTKVFALLFSPFLRFTCGLNRLSTTRLDVFERYAEQGNNIFALWHSRLLYPVYYYLRTAKKRRVSILVSMSRDGDYGAELIRKFKHDVIRGSTSKGGGPAIRRLIARAAEGNNIAITPDGPRGPAFRVNEGVIRLAQLTGARIIPLSYDATRKRKLRSWDGFILVKPFGRVHMALGEPIEVPNDIGPDEVEKHRRNLEKTLLELDRICAEKVSTNDAKQMTSPR